MENDATGPVYLFQNVVPGPCCAAFAGFVTPSGDPFVSTAEEPNVQNTDAKGWGLTVNYDISESISLRSVTSYSEQSLDATRDIDGTSVALLSNVRQEDMDEFSQELTSVSYTHLTLPTKRIV